MPIQQGTTHTWTKSSYSTGNGACVEVKSPATRVVAVRDSKDPSLGALSFRPEAWVDFVERVSGR
ncbi:MULTISPECIES: DUF397 domain-containing protein [unclassified Streptomyces]|uniref:DUF397 domain-containing protein n=1 Tax=unclassified Streptomyces TaxID=2593676 RepID=UPI002DD81A15|nr:MULTISPECIES: DUF397 domain-containing protein [unclassified Streptomyces]WSA94105.1 DUF397 domain-containing protein [Streptomyces sp. NBC_01795]WSB78530.1 DUF397 domain-containing protein [Streptomyces sp. NBC_01775]WSS13270.1 DUF397 domain-containing protein [Streptomyces sp. NBC_01186]WSS42057.1 DUF397 domain-containing protein [Streptomyces sp. NBC_01187]